MHHFRHANNLLQLDNGVKVPPRYVYVVVGWQHITIISKINILYLSLMTNVFVNNY